MFPLTTGTEDVKNRHSLYKTFVLVHTIRCSTLPFHNTETVGQTECFFALHSSWTASHVAQRCVCDTAPTEFLQVSAREGEN